MHLFGSTLSPVPVESQSQVMLLKDVEVQLYMLWRPTGTYTAFTKGPHLGPLFIRCRFIHISWYFRFLPSCICWKELRDGFT